MAFIDLGKLKFNWQGTWNAGTAYETDDVVFHNNQTYVAVADIATGQSEPQANASWELMNGGLNFRGVYSSATTYYLHDMVTYGSALYLLSTDNQTNVDPGSNPGSDNWDILTPAPDANVLHAVGDMVYRNKANGTARLVVVPEEGKGLTTVEAPLETYEARAFTYEEVSGYGNTFTTAGSIPAVSYTITTAVQRGATTHENWIVTGEDRNGAFTDIQDGDIYVNIGDTIVFDNSGVTGHPMQIVVSDGGAAVSTGTYTGGGTATVTWVTTGVAAGTYYYQCQTAGHQGMIGQIIVQDTTNRQGSNTGHGSIDVCRGKEFTISIDNVTNTGVAYDLFVDTGTAGTSKQLTSAEGSSGQVTYNGSAVTLTFTPTATTPNTVYIRNSSGTAVNPAYVEITVNDLKYVPSWGKATARRKTAAAGASSGFVSGVRGFGTPNLNVHANNPVSDYRTEYGHGFTACNSKGGYYEFEYVGAQGNVMLGGGNVSGIHSYYKHGLGYHTNVDTDFLSTPHLEIPQVVLAATRGDTNYSKWLTDVHTGDDLGYPITESDSDWDGEVFTQMNAKYVEVYQAMLMHILTENGMLYGTGYDGYGASHGNGAPGNYPNKPVPIRFLDTGGTDKVDTNYPKIKMMACSAAGDNTYSATTTQHAALDVDGNVYMGGYGNYGSPWGTGNDYYYRQYAQSQFGNYPVEYISMCCDSYNRGYAINNQGALYAWGYNGYGQIGNGSATNVNAPASSMTGSLTGKRVIHVNGTGGNSSLGQSMALCDDGTVHFVGYDTYGLIGTSAGSYTTTWNEKSNASTTINSGSRKVEAIYPVMQDSCMAICNDGTLWATGYNGYGQLGDASGGTNQSGWVEVKVKLKTNHDVTASSLHSAVSSYEGGFGDTAYWSGKHRVGRAKAVFSHFINSSTSSRIVIIDEYGTLFACGHWSGQWNISATNNSSTNILYSAEPYRGQPEPMVWWNFTNDDASEGTIAAFCVGESGLVYTYSTSGAYNNSLGSNDYTAVFAPLNA